MSTATLDKPSSAGDAKGTASPYITVTFRIRRFNPEVSDESTWQDFEVEIDPKERVLDGLHKIKWELDGSLTFRRSCAHGICGSDAMRINGRNRLACKTLIKDLNPHKPITVFDDTTKCILCAACTSSCPVFWNDGQYFGPAAIVNAHRFIFDSRDEAGEQRLEILNDKDGVWRCRTTFNCTEACPRGIEITKAIQEVKRALITRRF
ncbi:succinate dehydrogenase [Streptomyces albus subsp. albus]|nr:succinate dehydrogenase [Streptomyces albus subsp. albus]